MRALFPSFYGSFDWHSVVQGHWEAFKLLKLHPDILEADLIRKVLDDHLQPERIEEELENLLPQKKRYFECPYGWAWLLYLYSELHGDPDEYVQRWEGVLSPLA